jgi:hypothetical protein
MYLIFDFREIDCDTDQHLIVTEVRERLEVIKRAAEKLNLEGFYLKKLNEGEVKEQYRVTITTSLQLWKT